MAPEVVLARFLIDYLTEVQQICDSDDKPRWAIVADSVWFYGSSASCWCEYTFPWLSAWWEMANDSDSSHSTDTRT